MKKPKVAIIHDWLTGMRGGEKCLEVFCEIFPDADLFTLLHEKNSVSRKIEGMNINTSFLQVIPGISKTYRNFLPLFPAAVESFDLRDYDLILSSSHCAAKGVSVPPGALHICYCYTPVRYAWGFFDDYFSSENALKKRLIKMLIARFKGWDLKSNKKVDYFVAISDNVKTRINECYDREADVIYPPVDLSGAEHAINNNEDYYFIVSAIVPYKRIDLAVESFNKNGKKLVIAGVGPGYEDLVKRASDNIIFTGWIDEGELKKYYLGCKAFIFPGEEDFGITPVEAQSYGKPVIAYGKGGVLETVIPLNETQEEHHPTGVFFKEQSVSAVNEAIEEFENNINKFDPEKIRENTSRFSRERFKREINGFIENKWSEHCRAE